MENKTFAFEVKDIDEDSGLFTGYAATFSKNADSYGDIIDPGAFRKTLKEGGKRVKILWNHNVYEPIGKPIKMVEDEKGLLVEGKLSLGVQRAKEVMSLMKDDVINEMSIGYDTISEKFEELGKTTIRHLKEVRLWDVSPVTFAANPEATIVGIKSELDMILKSGRVLTPFNKGRVETALKALQALLEPTEDEEPSLDTLPSKELKEAAEMEVLVGKINAEIGGFDYKAASARIEEFIKNMEVN